MIKGENPFEHTPLAVRTSIFDLRSCKPSEEEKKKAHQVLSMSIRSLKGMSYKYKRFGAHPFLDIFVAHKSFVLCDWRLLTQQRKQISNRESLIFQPHNHYLQPQNPYLGTLIKRSSYSDLQKSNLGSLTANANLAT